MDLYIPLATRPAPLRLHSRLKAVPVRRAKARKALRQPLHHPPRLRAHALAMPPQHKAHALTHALARTRHDAARRAPEPHIEALLRHEHARILSAVQGAALRHRAPNAPRQRQHPQQRQRGGGAQHGVQRAGQRTRVAQVQGLQRRVRGEQARQRRGVEGHVGEREARQPREVQAGRQAQARGGVGRPGRAQGELRERGQAVERGGQRGGLGCGWTGRGAQDDRYALDVVAQGGVLGYE